MERPGVGVACGDAVGDVHQLVAVVFQPEAVGGRRGAAAIQRVRALAVDPRGVTHIVVLGLLVVESHVVSEKNPLAVVGRDEAALVIVHQAVAALARLATALPGVGAHPAAPAVLVGATSILKTTFFYFF